MGLLKSLFQLRTQKNNIDHDAHVDYVIYKIVDRLIDQRYVLQCINVGRVFTAGIMEIIEDTDILYGLHPVQACYVGIECVTENLTTDFSLIYNHEAQASRYGKYQLYAQDRQGKIVFFDLLTQKQETADPCDIAFSENWIQEFDAPQAFTIGILAGLKMLRTKSFQKSHLRLVK